VWDTVFSVLFFFPNNKGVILVTLFCFPKIKSSLVILTHLPFVDLYIDRSPNKPLYLYLHDCSLSSCRLVKVSYVRHVPHGEVWESWKENLRNYDFTRVRVCRKCCLIVGTDKTKSYKAQATVTSHGKNLHQLSLDRYRSPWVRSAGSLTKKNQPHGEWRQLGSLSSSITLKEYFHSSYSMWAHDPLPLSLQTLNLRITNGDTDILSKNRLKDIPLAAIDAGGQEGPVCGCYNSKMSFCKMKFKYQTTRLVKSIWAVTPITHPKWKNAHVGTRASG